MIKKLMRVMLTLYIFIFSPYLFAFNGNLYLCDSTNWVEIKLDKTNKIANTTFSFYIDTDKLKFIDSSGYFDNTEFSLISKEFNPDQFLASGRGSTYRYANEKFTYTLNSNKLSSQPSIISMIGKCTIFKNNN